MEICAFNNYLLIEWKYNLATTIGRLNVNMTLSTNIWKLNVIYQINKPLHK